MLTRRDFLRGLLASVASAALVKNRVPQPEQVVGVDWAAEGVDRSVDTVFDTPANTWRERQSLGHMLLGTFDAWAQMTNLPDVATVRMRAAITEEYLPDYSYKPFAKLDNFGISSDAVARRIRGLQTRTERVQVYHQAVLEMSHLREYIDATPT